jgi:hypothetical protein
MMQFGSSHSSCGAASRALCDRPSDTKKGSAQKMPRLVVGPGAGGSSIGTYTHERTTLGKAQRLLRQYPRAALMILIVPCCRNGYVRSTR